MLINFSKTIGMEKTVVVEKLKCVLRENRRKAVKLFNNYITSKTSSLSIIVNLYNFKFLYISII